VVANICCSLRLAVHSNDALQELRVPSNLAQTGCIFWGWLQATAEHLEYLLQSRPCSSECRFAHHVLTRHVLHASGVSFHVQVVIGHDLKPMRRPGAGGRDAGGSAALATQPPVCEGYLAAAAAQEKRAR